MTNKELIARLQELPQEANVKILQEDLSGERYFDLESVENLTRLLMTTEGIEQVETVVLGI